MKILIGITGSIAAYKAAELVRVFKRDGHEVKVVMTEAATHFVGELTFRTLSCNPVAMEMFSDTEEWKPEHISLADWADLFLVAPCTANVIAKMAHGISDDLLSCTALAVNSPVAVAPAMNDRMWAHPATQENVATLKSRGVKIIEVGEGDLACGYEGKGRMAAVADIASVVCKMRNVGS